MKKIFRTCSCLLLAAMLLSVNQSKAAKLVASETYTAGTKLTMAKENISPYLPLKAMIITQCYVGYQLFALSNDFYNVNINYGESVDNNPPPSANTPIDLTVNGSVTSTSFTGSMSGTILAGNSHWTSPSFYSTYTPTISLSSTNPVTVYPGVPIIIVN